MENQYQQYQQFLAYLQMQQQQQQQQQQPQQPQQQHSSIPSQTGGTSHVYPSTPVGPAPNPTTIQAQHQQALAQLTHRATTPFAPTTGAFQPSYQSNTTPVQPYAGISHPPLTNGGSGMPQQLNATHPVSHGHPSSTPFAGSVSYPLASPQDTTAANLSRMGSAARMRTGPTGSGGRPSSSGRRAAVPRGPAYAIPGIGQGVAMPASASAPGPAPPSVSELTFRMIAWPPFDENENPAIPYWFVTRHSEQRERFERFGLVHTITVPRNTELAALQEALAVSLEGSSFKYVITRPTREFSDIGRLLPFRLLQPANKGRPQKSDGTRRLEEYIGPMPYSAQDLANWISLPTGKFKPAHVWVQDPLGSTIYNVQLMAKLKPFGFMKRQKQHLRCLYPRLVDHLTNDTDQQSYEADADEDDLSSNDGEDRTMSTQSNASTSPSSNVNDSLGSSGTGSASTNPLTPTPRSPYPIRQPRPPTFQLSVLAPTPLETPAVTAPSAALTAALAYDPIDNIDEPDFPELEDVLNARVTLVTDPGRLAPPIATLKDNALEHEPPQGWQPAATHAAAYQPHGMFSEDWFDTPLPEGYGFPNTSTPAEWRSAVRAKLDSGHDYTAQPIHLTGADTTECSLELEKEIAKAVVTGDFQRLLHHTLYVGTRNDDGTTQSVGSGVQKEATAMMVQRIFSNERYFSPRRQDFKTIAATTDSIQALVPRKRLFACEVYGAACGFAMATMFLTPENISPFLLQFCIHGTLRSMSEEFVRDHDAETLEDILSWRKLGTTGAISSEPRLSQYFYNYEHVQPIAASERDEAFQVAYESVILEKIQFGHSVLNSPEIRSFQRGLQLKARASGFDLFKAIRAIHGGSVEFLRQASTTYIHSFQNIEDRIHFRSVSETHNTDATLQERLRWPGANCCKILIRFLKGHDAIDSRVLDSLRTMYGEKIDHKDANTSAYRCQLLWEACTGINRLLPQDEINVYLEDQPTSSYFTDNDAVAEAAFRLGTFRIRTCSQEIHIPAPHLSELAKGLNPSHDVGAICGYLFTQLVINRRGHTVL